MIHSNFGEPILTAIYHIPIQLCLLGIWSMMTRGLAVSRRSSVWIIFTWKKHPADYQRANQKKHTAECWVKYSIIKFPAIPINFIHQSIPFRIRVSRKKSLDGFPGVMVFVLVFPMGFTQAKSSADRAIPIRWPGPGANFSRFLVVFRPCREVPKIWGCSYL